MGANPAILLAWPLILGIAGLLVLFVLQIMACCMEFESRLRKLRLDTITLRLETLKKTGDLNAGEIDRLRNRLDASIDRQLHDVLRLHDPRSDAGSAAPLADAA